MSLLANHNMIKRAIIPTVIEVDEGFDVSNTSCTLAFAATPSDGELLIFCYRSTSGAPTSTPSGLTSITSIDNNGLGIYLYYKIASSETNSYIFADASTNYKGVVGYRLRDAQTPAVAESGDSGAVNVGSIDLPTMSTHSYAINTLTIGFVVTLNNRVISRVPLGNAFGVTSDGLAGQYKLLTARLYNPAPASYQITFGFGSATRTKAVIITV